MENEHINMEWQPELERPVLVAAFTGWNDAAEAASVSLNTLKEAWGVKQFASFDGEEFFDYQAIRPQIKLVDGVTRTVQWPQNNLFATEAGIDALGGRGAILLSGPEPNFRWKA
ncbi:MAG: PAC2 family protein, partial [Actinomycetota bacterium]|nr:PAC2 family protein [Actinomycetota bacterium]